MSRYGWTLKLDRCIGCESCMVACKAENNTRPTLSPLTFKDNTNLFPKHVSWRWVVKEENGKYPYPKRDYISMACNHCKTPACKASCPVGAISQRDDGIVLIDQDKCIGCQYCNWACPYGAPRFNEVTKKSEKCTFCFDRLEAGMKPACVATCIGRALTHTDDFDFSDSGRSAPKNFADPAKTKPAIAFENR